MGARGYPAELRRRVVELVNSGRKVAEVAILVVSGEKVSDLNLGATAVGECSSPSVERSVTSPALSSAVTSELQNPPAPVW